MRLIAQQLFLCLLLVTLSRPALAKAHGLDLHYGVVTDPSYFCAECAPAVFLPAYWQNFAQKRDLNAVAFADIDTAEGLIDLPSVDVLVIPATNSTFLFGTAVAFRDAIREFILNGGIVLAQNGFGSAPSSFNFFGRIFGFGYSSNRAMEQRNMALTKIAQTIYPALPTQVSENFHVSSWDNLDDAFMPIYLCDNKPSVAIAHLGEGALIVFGFAASGEDLGKTQLEILDEIVNVTRVPVF